MAHSSQVLPSMGQEFVAEIKDVLRGEFRHHLQEIRQMLKIQGREQQVVRADNEREQFRTKAETNVGDPSFGNNQLAQRSCFDRAETANQGFNVGAHAPKPSVDAASATDAWPSRRSAMLADMDMEDRLFGSHVLADVLMSQPIAVADEKLTMATTESLQLQIVAASQMFDVFSVLVIFCNSVLIGVETDYLAKHGQSNDSFQTAQVIFNVWYIAELLIRVAASRWRFVFGSDRCWNAFDALMVAVSVLDLAVDQNMQVGRLVRVIRVVRIARTMRVLHTLHCVREFRKMVFALTTSTSTLFCSLVVLFLVMYVFAVWFTQGVAHHQADLAERGMAPDDLEKFYGDLMTTIYTLYRSVTSGLTWGEAATPLLEVSRVYAALFIAFISTTFFGVLNIIMGIFVESAMESAQSSRQLLMAEKVRSKDVYSAHLKQIFKEIDSDRSGGLTIEEVVTSIKHDAKIQTYFEALDINASDVQCLFMLLDADDSGEVDLNEFCDGCAKIKGDASSYDVHCLIYEHRRMHKWMSKFMAHVEQAFERTRLENASLNRAVARLTLRPASVSSYRVPVEARVPWGM